jgi:septal ring factor EnvC (AmiA/AmiB activator)
VRVPRPELTLLFGASLMAASAVSLAARADNPAAKLYTIEQNAAQSRAERNALALTAAALAGEIDGLRRQSVSAAEAMQTHEAALSMLESQLQSLNAEAAQKAAELQRDEAARGGLLMALVALARNPPEALALTSPDPVIAERSALVLGNAVPPLDRAARKLSTHLRQLALLRQAIAAAESHHRTEQNLLSSQQSQLADLIARKSELQREAQAGTEQSEEKIVALAAEAASLKDLIERLDAEKKRGDVPNPAHPVAFPLAQPEPSAMPKPTPVAAPAIAPSDPSKPPKLRSFLYAPGNYLVPASGKLVQNFGKPNEVGLTSQGLAYETRAGAQVVAPYDGRVLFAGPFRGYGQILIIEHGDGYHSLLAGLDGLDVSVGQWLVAGEPVGIMPKGGNKPRLYLELRHDGQPINPLPWLATPNEKVSG